MPEDTRDFAVDYEPAEDSTDGDHDRATAPAVPVEIPLEALSADAAAGIINAFVLREGTDYGAVETSHEAKVAQVRRQLEKGEVVITFDPATETVTLLSREDWNRARLGRA